MRRALTTVLVAAAIVLGALTLVGLGATPGAGATPRTAIPTTVAPLSQLPTAPSTLPLTTKPPSAHISPVFAELSGAGFAIVVLLLLVQCVLTRPGRRGRRTL